MKSQFQGKKIRQSEDCLILLLNEHFYFLCFFFLDSAFNSKSLHLICKFLSASPLTNTKIVTDKTIQVGVLKSSIIGEMFIRILLSLKRRSKL